MTHTEENVELVRMLADARTSARLQLLELLDSKLDRLNADNATREQIISTLKKWVSVRQAIKTNTPEGGTLS
ncbi:hypothetical protein GE191_01010 [Serratia fonticola]|uniref:hypothetical protein n=1 Tax=Serratia fonticola TaxID=47917 RepID=UPI001376EE2D|nr:hypothetical protein [Serratia fonticola]NBJ32258.1 hypothetical protein [Serratia fonticola]